MTYYNFTPEEMARWDAACARVHYPAHCEFVDAVRASADPSPLQPALVNRAREIRSSDWWRTLPTYAAPAPVTGEIAGR